MERIRKAQSEIQNIDTVSNDIDILTLSDIYTREESFAVRARVIVLGMGDGDAEAESRYIVYLHTDNAGHAVRFAKKLALTFKAARRAGSAQHGTVSSYDRFCEPSPVRSLGAQCAEAIAMALGLAGVPA